MSKKKSMRILTLFIVCILAMSCFSVTAFAGGGEDEEQIIPTTPEVEVAVDDVPDVPDEPIILPISPSLTPDGNLTLVDDIKSSDEENKQFITVQSKAGNYFYIIIDRSPASNGEIKENVYFLNLVDEADLLALIEDEEFVNDYEAGKEPPQTLPDQPEETTNPTETEEPEEPIKEKSGSGFMIVLLVVLLAGGAGGGYYYIKFVKGKKPNDDDMVFYDDDGYEEELYINEDEIDEGEITTHDEDE